MYASGTGVGSIGVAALEMKRKFIGVEIEEPYFLAAKNRIENVVRLCDEPLHYDVDKCDVDSVKVCEPQSICYCGNDSVEDFIKLVYDK